MLNAAEFDIVDRLIRAVNDMTATVISLNGATERLARAVERASEPPPVSVEISSTPSYRVPPLGTELKDDDDPPPPTDDTTG